LEIGNRVRARRRALDLSQDALARRADVSLSLINQMERGIITDPHITTLVAVANALGVPVSDLLEEERPLVGAR
jgi:transcriptional regulator with XRE-family HTH domain